MVCHNSGNKRSGHSKLVGRTEPILFLLLLPLYIYCIYFFLQTVGVNGQGFANAILFCILTKPVRQRLKMTFRKAIDKISSCYIHTRHDGRVSEDVLHSTSVNDEELLMSYSSNSYNSLTN